MVFLFDTKSKRDVIIVSTWILSDTRSKCISYSTIYYVSSQLQHQFLKMSNEHKRREKNAIASMGKDEEDVDVKDRKKVC